LFIFFRATTPQYFLPSPKSFVTWTCRWLTMIFSPTRELPRPPSWDGIVDYVIFSLFLNERKIRKRGMQENWRWIWWGKDGRWWMWMKMERQQGKRIQGGKDRTIKNGRWKLFQRIFCDSTPHLVVPNAVVVVLIARTSLGWQRIKRRGEECRCRETTVEICQRVGDGFSCHTT